MVTAKIASSKADEYDDESAVQSYLEQYWTWYMTDFEKRCFNLSVRLAKAVAQPDSDWAQRVFVEWRETTDTEQRSALAEGLDVFQERTRRRILNDIDAGTLRINRCPRCNRVVRTPSAQQCFWCGHDWHV